MAPELVPASVKPDAAEPAAAEPAARRVYVTFLAGNGDHVKGVVGLAKGLRKAGSAYPLVVAVLPDVPEEHRRVMMEQGCLVREIEPVYPPENQTTYSMVDYAHSYSKLRMWEFVEFSKVVFLDLDMLVTCNIDDLFDKEDRLFHAVKACFCDKTPPSEYDFGYCQQSLHCSDPMGPPPPPYFNDGMFVFEPNCATYNDLLNTLRSTPPTPLALQGFLNTYFRNIYKPLPLEYNLDISMLWTHPEVELGAEKVVQFRSAGLKPWRLTGHGEPDNMQTENIKTQLKKLYNSIVGRDIKILFKKWQDIYQDKSLDYNN